ncbi:DUF1810 domain-containing protein [Aurantimonas sp. 22II-16-19i]|jgi:uncharacterized protein (DUF1810 family)|uniref:DUF1810 domain-containing protein n=1 Tax=Aurantimonas sp. 22II-16-19i TaxID=1317114 RepID=UPI0009F7F4E0|nr:DUF1810 domain-containing protein [Aurantimonas sp. 22II-16-19i]ORE90090.1 hypothetical protein ATO4_22403 [Aurantimonas sp. 22II-16-19i]
MSLNRFVEAQAPVYHRALAELQAGNKQSHWMWFVFPQIAGLGSSPMAQRYAIQSLDEAKDYLAHELLGRRLAECTAAVLAHPDSTVHAIFGSPDDMKFHSSMTLFHRADPRDELFGQALEVFFDGEEDKATLSRI